MKKIIILSLILAFFSADVFAQSPLKFGFRGGIGFANFNSSGNELPGEVFDNTFGFHVGMLIQYNIVKNFGVRAEFSYVQRGTDYTYEAPGYDIVRSEFGNDVLMQGDKLIRLAYNTDYIDLPISLVFKPAKAIEINGGMYIGTMLTAKATGRKVMSNLDQNVNYLGSNSYEQTLEYNFNKDNFRSVNEDAGSTQIIINNNPNSIPNSIGAYYDFDLNDEKLFNRFDYGWQCGISIYLNESLFFGVKYLHGLSDVTNNAADVSPAQVIDIDTPVLRDKKDTNSLWQISIGFAF